MQLLIYFKWGTVLFDLLAVVAGLLYFKRLKRQWKYFVYFLIFILISEILGYWFLKGKLNALYFSYVVIPIELTFFFWLFAVETNKKSLFWWSWGSYLAAVVLELAFSLNDKKEFYLSFSYTIGNLILLVLSIHYFYQFIFSDSILKFKSHRMFWVVLGLILFFLGTFPYYGLYNLLVESYFNLLVSYTWVVIFLDYAMYTCFALSFILGKDDT